MFSDEVFPIRNLARDVREMARDMRDMSMQSDREEDQEGSYEIRRAEAFVDLCRQMNRDMPIEHLRRAHNLLPERGSRFESGSGQPLQTLADKVDREADLEDLLDDFRGLIRGAGVGVEAAKAAELRAAVLIEAEAQVMVCENEVALLRARQDLRYFRDVPSGVMSNLEDRVRQARADESVAKANVKLLTAEMKALQLTAELKAEMKALQLRKSDQVQASGPDDATQSAERAVE